MNRYIVSVIFKEGQANFSSEDPSESERRARAYITGIRKYTQEIQTRKEMLRSQGFNVRAWNAEDYWPISVRGPYKASLLPNGAWDERLPENAGDIQC